MRNDKFFFLFLNLDMGSFQELISVHVMNSWSELIPMKCKRTRMFVDIYKSLMQAYLFTGLPRRERL